MGKFNPHSPDCKINTSTTGHMFFNEVDDYSFYIIDKKGLRCSKRMLELSLKHTPYKLEKREVIIDEKDMVNHPPHYMLCDVEAKDIIKLVLNSNLCSYMSMWQAACFKDVLKYRLRAGKKGDAMEDIDKSKQYELMFEEEK